MNLTQKQKLNIFYLLVGATNKTSKPTNYVFPRAAPRPGPVVTFPPPVFGTPF